MPFPLPAAPRVAAGAARGGRPPRAPACGSLRRRGGRLFGRVGGHDAVRARPAPGPLCGTAAVCRASESPGGGGAEPPPSPSKCPMGMAYDRSGPPPTVRMVPTNGARRGGGDRLTRPSDGTHCSPVPRALYNKSGGCGQVVFARVFDHHHLGWGGGPAARPPPPTPPRSTPAAVTDCSFVRACSPPSGLLGWWWG
eukprot:gene13493-biopygen11072